MRGPILAAGVGLLLAAHCGAQSAPPAAAPPRIDLEQAMELALAHSPAMQAARSQIPQSQAEEITAAIKPNPVLSWDALYLPIFNPGAFSATYLNDTVEFDASMAYTIERGGKRQARTTAARDATAVVRAQVSDDERSLRFNVAQQFFNVLLGKSSLNFAQQDLDSWRHTDDLSQAQFSAGALSRGDLDTIKIQTLQYGTIVSQDRLATEQALYLLRQTVGLSVLAPGFDVTGDLVFEAVHGNEADFKMLALQNRPDLAAARLGVNAAKSQYALAKANGKRDLTVTGQYSHVGGTNDVGSIFSIEVPLYDRNQGEIARTAGAITQAEDQAQQATEQVLTDVANAYAAVTEGAKVIDLYDSGYRDEAKEALDIVHVSYDRGASSLLDVLDAERTYRQTELGYRQALATYMLAVEQLKEAAGVRALP